MTRRSQLFRRLPNDIALANRHQPQQCLRAPGREPKKGKHRSRRNTVRHGLTAETVIGAIDDAEDYTAFESVIAADYNAQSAVERKLVLRLASLSWRLRRATAIEAGLFEIQVEHLSELIKDRSVAPVQPQILYSLLRHASIMKHHLRPLSVTSKRKIPSTQLRPIHRFTLSVLFCGSRIYRIAFSAAMKPRSGGKCGRHLSCLTP
jgi:hypothetical protein